MTSDDTDLPAHNPRMHQGGKLSFRGRVQEGDDQPGDRLVLGGKNPPSLRELTPPGFADVEIEIGPGTGAFVLAGAACGAAYVVFLAGRWGYRTLVLGGGQPQAAADGDAALRR